MEPVHRPVLSASERQRRWGLAREFLRRHQLDAIVVFGEHEDAGAAPYAVDNWFTNDRPGSTIVFPKEGDPIVLVPFRNSVTDHADAVEKGESPWIDASNFRMGRDAKALGRVLDELHLGEGIIGVLGLEPSPPWHPEGIIPFDTWSSISSQLPKAKFTSLGTLFIPLLMTLSDEELSLLRYSADTGEQMAEAMVRSIRAGVSEDVVYAAGMSVALSRGTVVPGMHLGSGPKAVIWGPPRWAWRAQAPRVLQSGDVIVSEIFCQYGMRHTQHQLTVALGPVNADIRRAAEIARLCYEAGLEALQPKRRFADVAKAMLKPVEAAGGWVKGPQVHSLNPIATLCGSGGTSDMKLLKGQGYPETPGWDTFMEEMTLEPGMSFAFEPSCGFGDHAVTLGGTVVVGVDGAIELNPFTAKLHHVS